MHGSPFGARGLRLPLPRVVAAAACAGVLVLTPLRSYADTRLAVIASTGAGVEKLAPLVEVRLGQRQGITLLERENIQEILREQELSALTAAEGTANRVQFGKLLKADLLVVLRGNEKPRPHAWVTVSETRQGLRLCNTPVEFSNDIKKDADAVLRLADKAIGRQQKPITDIVAVPPFVNNTLAYEGDQLKAGSARLVEELLLDRPGVLVVELAEAKAIVQELTIANGETLHRRLPLYLLGEYRLEGIGAARTVGFKLTLRRGPTQIDARTDTAATVEQFPKRLRDTAAALFSQTLGQAVRPPDPKAEAEQLAQRARLFTRLGNWEEGLGLTEAALLLQPDRVDLHGDAIHQLNEIVEAQRSAEIGMPRERWQSPGDAAAKALLGATVHHAEVYLLGTRIDRNATVRWLPGAACERYWNLVRDFPDRAHYERWLSENRPQIEAVRGMCRRVLAVKAQGKVQDQTLHLLYQFLELPLRTDSSRYSDHWRVPYFKERIGEICAGRMELLKEFSYLTGPNPPWMLLDVVQPGGRWQVAEEPALQDFLAKAEALPDPGLRRYAQNFRQGYKAAVEAHAKVVARMRSPGPRSQDVKPPLADAEVLFHPLSIPGLKPPVTLWRGLDEGRDLLLIRDGPLGADVERWRLAILAKDGLHDVPGVVTLSDPVNSQGWIAAGARPKPINVCWDGRYLWALNPGKDGPLAVIDPDSRKVWRLERDGGLPESISCGVTPLEPGKVCVAGYFGRLWCGVATFEPPARLKLDVFHEATEVLDQRKPRRDPAESHPVKVAAPINYMATLRDAAGGGKRTRVVVGRDTAPLLINPETREVQVASHYVLHVYQVWEHNGALYWGDVEGGPTSTDNLYRLGFPRFGKELVNPAFPVGACAVQKGRVHAINHHGKYLVAESLGGKFRQRRGDVPINQPQTSRFQLVVSNLYGLLLLTDAGVYQVEVK